MSIWERVTGERQRWQGGKHGQQCNLPILRPRCSVGGHRTTLLADAHLEDLHAPLLVGQPNLHLHLQAAGAQERLVQHVTPAPSASRGEAVQRVGTAG